MDISEDTVEFFPEEEEVSSSSSATDPVTEEEVSTPSFTVPVQTQVVAPVTTMTTPDKPTKPIMGGLRNFGTHHDAWTGGKPNSDWTGLDMANPQVNNPNQLRSYSIKARSSFNARRNGLYHDEPARKFKSGGNLDYFCQNLRTAFLDNGMDTICYRKDPLTLSASVKMVDVLG